MKTVLFSLFLLIIPSIFAQVIRGTISDETGKRIPFAKVRVANTSYGSVSNANGVFQLGLKNGRHVLEFSAPGYQNFVDSLYVSSESSELNIVLKEEIKQLEEVRAQYQTKKEMGREIMKKAGDKRSYFQELISEYSCDIYCFSSLEKEKKDTIKKDSVIGKEKMNIIEWSSRSYFKEKAKFKDEFFAYNDFTDPLKGALSTSVGFTFDSEESLAKEGSLQSNVYLFATGIKEAHFSIFENSIDAPKIAQNPLISLLAFNAFFYYNFYLEQTFTDSLGQMTYEIRVSPKFDYEALFKGTIYIKDGSWEVSSYDLQVNPKVLLLYKEMHIICDYIKVGDRLVPSRKEFIYDIKEGKTIINGLIRLTQKNYSFEINDKAKNFWLETSVYKDDAFDKDSVFWNETRPFSLKEIEKQFIREQDSIINYHESDEYLRKIDSTRNKLKVLNILFGGFGHQNSFKKYSFSINGLVTQMIPFGVGGYRHRLNVSYNKEFKNGKKLSINPEIDYGFLNKDVKGSFDGSFMYNTLNFSRIGFKIGDVYDFVTGNTNIQGAFAPANRVRNKRFEVNFSREITNGLYLKSSLLFSDRTSIDSLKYPSWIELFGKFKTSQSFDPYRILLLTLDFEYHFRQKYVIRKKRKIVLGSPWPVLNLQYKKSLPDIFATDANFDFIEFRVTDEIKLNSFGQTDLKFTAGAFLQKQDLRIIEHKFFRPSDQLFFSNPVNTLQLLDTALNTSKSYMQFNFIHHFNGFFLNKIWLINKLKLEESVGGGMLFIPDAHFAQVEFYVGLERRFRIRGELFKIGVYAITQDNSFDKASINFKIGVNFYNSFRDKWDY